MQEAFRQLAPEISTATTQTEQHANAVQRSALAIQAHTTAGIELLAKGMVGLIAGRKAQAAVEAIWETARGIALLAEGTWPPNPAAIIAAGLHFEAAAQYALLAGTGSHRRERAGGRRRRGLRRRRQLRRQPITVRAAPANPGAGCGGALRAVWQRRGDYPRHPGF